MNFGRYPALPDDTYLPGYDIGSSSLPIIQSSFSSLDLAPPSDKVMPPKSHKNDIASF